MSSTSRARLAARPTQICPRVRTVSTSSLATAAVQGVRYRLSRLVSLHRSERGGEWWLRCIRVMRFTMFNVIAWLGLAGLSVSGRVDGCFNESLTALWG